MKVTGGLDLTGEDTFFITFLATWLSVRINVWGDKNILQLILILLGILCFQLVVIQIRHLIFMHNHPDYADSASSKSRNTILRYSTMFLVVIVLYFAWKNTSYLESKDIYIFAAMALLWMVFPAVDFFSGLTQRRARVVLNVDEGAKHNA